MKYIKEYNQFILEEENIVKKLLLSTILSLGLTYADAQVIQQDTSKIDIVNSISKYNKSILFTGEKELPYNTLKKELFNYVEDPDLFIDKYLLIQNNGTLIIKQNFIDGLRLELKLNGQKQIGLGYNITF